MKRAFTLIELLVVIAIIAILAAILFPVFAQAKLAAKKTQDLSNVKNISLAIHMYASDYEDTFPRQVYASGVNLWGWDTPTTWRETVQPYVKNGVSNYIDGANQVPMSQGGIWDTPNGPAGARGHYNSNRILMPAHCYWNGTQSAWVCDSTPQGVPNGTPTMPSVPMTSLDAPAQIASMWTVGINPDWNASGDFSESSWWWFGGAQWPPVFTGPTSGEQWDADSNVQPNWSMPRYRYTGGLNLGFADGHAGYVRKGAFNWCRYVHVRDRATDWGENWNWLFDPGQPCAAFAR